MKTFLHSLYTIAFCFAFTAANAQISQSSEPRAQVNNQTGEVIILPVQYSAPVAETVTADKKVAQSYIRNVSQKRDARLGKKRNGYYQMADGQDWGTNARLNRYGYTYSVTRKVETDMPVAQTESQDLSGSLAQLAKPVIAEASPLK